MAGGSVETRPPAIFMNHTSGPQSAMMVVVVVVMMVMMMGLCRGGHCQNGKGCASEDHFL
jgi:hypothetical protein